MCLMLGHVCDHLDGWLFNREWVIKGVLTRREMVVSIVMTHMNLFYRK